MSIADLRDEFPVLRTRAYLNAGTTGPIPARAVAAANACASALAEDGRSGAAHVERMLERRAGLRAGYARWLGCDAYDVALTRSTTDGVNAVVSALDFDAQDDVLTSDEEHPGILAPLGAAVLRRGIRVRTAPFRELAAAVRPETRLVACSHVSWITGAVADTEALAASGAIVLLDGAQGIGAVPLDVGRLGCDAYAASGQKWLCGPEGTGALYVSSRLRERVVPPWPGYESLEDPVRALELPAHRGGAGFDMGTVPGPAADWALASLAVLEDAGRAAVTARGPELAARLAALLADAGREVVPRGKSTLVSWRSEDPAAEVERLAAAGFVVREIPGRGLVRASVGAWSTEDELERLAATSSSSR